MNMDHWRNGNLVKTEVFEQNQLLCVYIKSQSVIGIRALCNVFIGIFSYLAPSCHALFMFRLEMCMFIARGAIKLGLDGMPLPIKNILIIMGHLLTSRAFIFR